MPRILAIDWDRREARAVLVNAGATGVSVSGAWAVSLATNDPDGLSGQQIGQRLAAAIGDKAKGKVAALVGVGRDNVQMQLLTLPPAPLDELPDLVRFQADREFHTLGAEAALDFVPISGDAQSQHQALAIALSPAGIAEARSVCESLGVELSRIPLRACAAAALVQRAGAVAADELALVVNPLTDEADLIVQAGEKVVLMRTVRLPDPSQAAGRQRAMLGEIRRTMAAVRQQLADRKVDQVVICSALPSPLGGGVGGGAEAAKSSASLAAELDVPVTYFDPLAHAPSGLASHGVSAESLSRFAAVLGMALNEADRRPPIIDFASVRKQVAKKRFTRTHVLAVAAAAIFVLWIAGTAWSQLSVPANELAELNEQIAQAQNDAAALKEVTDQAAAIERWLATDVNWLDELEQFARQVRPEPVTSKEFPVNDDVVITQIILTRPAGNNPMGGQLNVNAVAKSDAAIRSLERRLSAGQHRITPGRIQKDNTLPGYPRSTDLQVHVERAEVATTAPIVSQPSSQPANAESQANEKRSGDEKGDDKTGEPAPVVVEAKNDAEASNKPTDAKSDSVEPKSEAAP